MSGRVKNLEYKNEMKSGVDGFILFGKLELQFPKKGIWNWDRFVCGFFFFFFFSFSFFQHSLPLKDGLQFQSPYPYLEKQRVPIFKFWDWRNFFSFSSLHRPLCSLYREKVKNESQRGHRKAWTPYHESKKKTTDLTGQHTHIHTPHAHTIFLILSLSLSLSIFSFLYGNPKSTSPHHLVLVLLSTTSYPTFFFFYLSLSSSI